MIPKWFQMTPKLSQMTPKWTQMTSTNYPTLNEECDNYLDVDYCVQDLGNLNVNMRQTWT